MQTETLKEFFSAFSATQSVIKLQPITYAHEWRHNFICYHVLCIVMPSFLLQA